MRPIESRTEGAVKTPRDAIAEAEKKYSVEFLVDSTDILLRAQIRAYSHKVNATPVHILLAVSTSASTWNSLLSRAELNWRLLDQHAFHNEKIDPISHLQTPITDGFIEVVDQAAKNTKDFDWFYVQPQNILNAALSHKDVIKALSLDEGAVDRIREEIDLVKGQQDLTGVVELLTSRNPSREYRLELLKRLRDSAGIKD